MKRTLFLIVGLLYTTIICSQVPDSFTYQTVIRNSSGELIANQDINFSISIVEGSIEGSSVFSETQLVKSNAYGVCNLKIGSGEDASVLLSSLNWGTNKYFLTIAIDETGNTDFTEIGAVELLSVPYSFYSNHSASADHAINAEVASDAFNADSALYADTSGYSLMSGNSNTSTYALKSDSANVAKRLDEDVLYFTDTDTLFAVKDRNGNIVFAVYPDGAKVYVNNATKGKVGGFAVTGRNPTKASIEENYMVITADSTRVYIPESSVKGSVGGFAVSGRNPTKGNGNDYFNISAISSANVDTINPSEARMVWYPKSEAFLVGRVLVEAPDSVGLNSIATGYESKAIGDYSQAFGYRSIARKDYSTAIGKNALANGINSFAFGDEAKAISNYAFAIGSGAVAFGEQSFALGSITQDTAQNFSLPPLALGDYSMAIGLGTKSVGLASVSLGANNRALGDFSTALGHSSTASGNRSITLGPYSTSAGYASTTVGYRNETTSDASFALAGGVGSKAYASGAIAFGAYCHAYGSRSVAMGDACTTDGFGSVAMGKGSDALATGAIAFGLGNIADGVRSVAMGAGAFTNKMEGAFVFNGGVEKSVAHATRAGQVVFLGSGGLNFYASTDTAEINSFVIMPGSGNIGVGTFNPTEKMEISGGSLLMTEGDIKLNGGVIIEGIGKNTKIADYVFTDDFELESIEEHAEFMWANKHLPALKGTSEIKKEGTINTSERREQIVEELEKAHIYIEQLHDRIKELESKTNLEKENQELRDRIENLENLVNQIINQ